MFRSIFADNAALALDDYADLASVPRHRTFQQNDMIDLFRKAVPFDFIAVAGMDCDGYGFGHGHSIDTDLPPAFLELYYGENWPRQDPFVSASRGASGIVVEEDVYKTSPPEQRLSYILRSFGVLNRTLVPLLRNKTVFGAVTFCRADKFSDLELAYLAMIAPSLHDAFVWPIMEKFAADHLKLTAGEIACLQGASDGATTDGISSLTGFQPATVDTYLKSATKKLKAKNRAHAVAEALRRRLVS
ncbi:LuxR C-terminal-related transcriptional regulator [Rhizobium sp.]|uniref:helix-turn-helix transcriptional regulator n=1 Tax=Rhizobium sp. TaxID=391 RepID=UPI0028A67B26